MKKTKIEKPKSNSLTDIAHYMLNNSDESYQSIADRSGLNFNYLLQFNEKYREGREFSANYLEKLITALGGEINVSVNIKN